jgi:prevent-host-death family protein
MITISASEAKTHFGALMDKAQKEPVTIEKQGRPVAVVISFEEYQEQYGQAPSHDEKKQALAFLKTWGKRPATAGTKGAFEGDLKAQAIWDKYNEQG